MPTSKRIATDLLTIALLVVLGVSLPLLQQWGGACLAAAAAARTAAAKAGARAGAYPDCVTRLARLVRAQGATAGSHSFCDDGTLITVELGSVEPAPALPSVPRQHASARFARAQLGSEPMQLAELEAGVQQGL